MAYKTILVIFNVLSYIPAAQEKAHLTPTLRHRPHWPNVEGCSIVKSAMSTAAQVLSADVNQEIGNDDLWRQYRLTFEVFARRVEEIQQLQVMPGTPPAVMTQALRQLDYARMAHNCSRDALAEALLCSSTNHR